MRHLPRRLLTAAVLSLAAPAAVQAQRDPAPLYRAGSFELSASAVRQGRFEARALSRDSIVSSYPRSGREVRFRFSLNGADNEFRPGTEHTLYVRPEGGRIVSPLYVFGVPPAPVLPTPEAHASSEEGTAQLTLRLDLRAVRAELQRSGSYTPPQGPPIARGELRAYALGDEPLSWDAATLVPGSPAELTDPDGDGIYSVTLPVQAVYTRPLASPGVAVWRRTHDLSAFPQLSSPQPLLDALYRMSLEELQQLVREDGALSAGAKWPGVWTRDVSYASVLALAVAAPDAVRRSLLAKVDAGGRIIQDTGTGGSWPISTDRMTWALAAWELYAVSGDRDWLRRAYDIISRSAEADRHAVLDPATGLALGETSFMDWREQSYPRWMEPSDIARSAGIGTNAVHYATYRILAEMAGALGEPAARWNAAAERLRTAINAELWLPGPGFYGEYRYGRAYPALEPRSDALGEALAILYGVAPPERRATLSARTPLVEFGAPVFWPYISGMPSYHNGALWPFVNAFWLWSAAEAGNGAGVEHGLAAVYRPAALFLTNKENMLASTGHFEGTALNSDRQLWSVAALLATHYRVLFGMRFLGDRLRFAPRVPRAYAGERTLSNLRWRGALLTVTVSGWGDGVASARLDGRALPRAELPATLRGPHRLELRLNQRWSRGAINLVPNRWAPETPLARLRSGALVWQPVPGAARYRVLRNGAALREVTGTSLPLPTGQRDFAEYQVQAVDAAGTGSFLSEPVRDEPLGSVTVARPRGVTLEREQPGYSGEGYVRLTREQNTRVELPLVVACSAAEYLVEPRYANGSGPVNTDSKAALRSLRVDGRPAGVLVMPQRGSGRWSEWGYGSGARITLTAGEHLLVIEYTPLDENMDRQVNTALLDHLRLTRLGSCR